MTEPQLPDGEELEGIDETESVGWDELPLNSVFVRTEQRTVIEVVKRIQAGRYDLNPEFQRDFVWPVDKQSRLIESCLMRIPLPAFYVAEAKDGRIVVVDGLQRLTTFSRFLNGDFALAGLGGDRDQPAAQESPLMGKRFSDLPLNLQERIEDTQLTLYVLDAKAPERAKLDIFERVNGGVALTRQQMRNCLYTGEATQWLKAASDSEAFLAATGGSLDRRSMRDREAINRFCAFTLLGIDRYKGDMDGYLAESLNKMNQLSAQELDALRAKFDHAMWANRFLFGEHAFRKSLGAGDQQASRSVLNIALFDVCSVLLSDIPREEVEARQAKLKDAVMTLVGDPKFNQAITSSTNSTKQVVARFNLAKESIRESLKC